MLNTAIGELNDTVKSLERSLGRDLFDEERFARSMAPSLENFNQEVQNNTFLEESEKRELLKKVDAKMAQTLFELLDNLYNTLEPEKEKYAKDIQIKLELLKQDASLLVTQLLEGAGGEIRRDSRGFLGITDEEFNRVVMQVDAAGPLPTHTINPFHNVEEIYTYFENGDAAMARCEVEGKTLYFKKVDENTVLVFTVDEPLVRVQIALDRITDTKYLRQKIQEEEEHTLKEKEDKKTIADDLRHAIRGDTASIQPISMDMSRIGQTEFMALESAYNMGLKATFNVKMQLLIYKLYEKKGWTLPGGFKLDGGWGGISRAALGKLLEEAKMVPESENSLAGFKALRALYQQEFNTKMSLFLTPEEIKDPHYKFENKGVFRGMQVESIKNQLLKNGFDIKTLAYGGQTIKVSDEVIRGYPRVRATLDRLTDDPNMKAIIIATMIMEKGISSMWDDVGLGRGDRKDAAYYLHRNWPRVAAVLDVDINSAGIMQVNYRTAQEMMRERTGQYWPKDLTIDRLKNNIELSTVIAFILYRDNLVRLQELQRQFY
ncbi:hypothetical protein HZA43_05290 [Candidatus Peregrinibacteria bacterium]|nr:hypothetical protein [Candidatus Peregrinibacteria bacterium]